MTPDQSISTINTNQSSNTKNTRRLNNLFSDTTIERIALVLLFVWNISPILAMLLSNLSQDDSMFRYVYKLFALTRAWYGILIATGFFGCILGIITFIKSKRKAKENHISSKEYIKSNLFPIFLFLLLYWSLISCLTQLDLKDYLIGEFLIRDGFLSHFAYGGIFCCGYLLCNKKMVILTLKVFTWVAVIQSILMMANNQNINYFFSLTQGSAAFYNINHFAYYLCMGVMASFLLMELEKKSKQGFIISMIQFSIISAALVYNTSLGPYLATVAALIGSLILAIWLDHSRIKIVLIAMALFLFITVMINLVFGYLLSDLGILGADFMSILNGMNSDSAGSGRWILWKDAVQYISAHPLLGSGPGRYTEEAIYYYNSSYRPHNEFLEYAASIGIPGMLFYVTALFLYAMEFIKKRKYASLLTTGLLCIVVVYLVSSLFGVTMYYTSPFFFMFLGIASKKLRDTSSKQTIVEMPQ